MGKRQLATHMAGTPILPLVKVTTEEKISSMCGQRYMTSKAGATGTTSVRSVINSIGERSALLLIAIGDCVVNKKSQAKIAKKYDILKSHIQRSMSGKHEHKKGGKQYQWEGK